MVSFGSPVVKKRFIGSYSDSDKFIIGISKFIDDFEDATREMRDKLGRRLIKDTTPEKNWANSKGVSYPQTEWSANELVDSYEVDKFLGLGLFTETKNERKFYKAKYLGGGVSGDVYSVYIDCKDRPSYVIKEAKKKKHSDPIRMSPGGIKSEFYSLRECQREGSLQRGVALMKTRDGNYFLVSEFEEGQPAGLKHLSRTQHEFNDIRYYPRSIIYNEKLEKTMDLIKSLDDRSVFNADLNMGNILYDNDPWGKPKLIDLQWQMPLHKAYDFFNVAPNETSTNFTSFEAGFVSSYLHDINEHYTLYGNEEKGRTEARCFLKHYLNCRSHYCMSVVASLERVRVSVYENPTEDVLDAEILRLSILKNHNHQFLYNDGLNETPRDMLKGLRYMARANFAAKMLSEFKPQKDESQMSENEKAYFEEMRKLGSFWHEKTKKWYREGLESMESKIIDYPQSRYENGDEQVYWPKAYGQGVNPADKPINANVPDKTMLSDVLSDGAKAKWDDVMEKSEVIEYRGRKIPLPSLKIQITTLEAAFMKLKLAVDKKDLSAQSVAKQDISNLINEVLI